jgi:hypothetical protein
VCRGRVPYVDLEPRARCDRIDPAVLLQQAETDNRGLIRRSGFSPAANTVACTSKVSVLRMFVGAKSIIGSAIAEARRGNRPRRLVPWLEAALWGLVHHHSGGMSPERGRTRLSAD